MLYLLYELRPLLLKLRKIRAHGKQVFDATARAHEKSRISAAFRRSRNFCEIARALACAAASCAWRPSAFSAHRSAKATFGEIWIAAGVLHYEVIVRHPVLNLPFVL